MSTSEIRTNELYRQGIIDWLTANGVNVKDVPPNSLASLADGKLTLELWYKIDGKQQFDPTKRDELARQTVTVDITVPPNAAAEFWLQPRCERCGR